MFFITLRQREISMSQTNIRHSSERIRSTLEAGNLPPSQVQMIQEALMAVGDFGEVRLVVEKGRIRYIIIQKSLDALSWQADKAQF
jgi:hypothetical protein